MGTMRFPTAIVIIGNPISWLNSRLHSPPYSGTELQRTELEGRAPQVLRRQEQSD
jgi:hypothetical protein